MKLGTLPRAALVLAVPLLSAVAAAQTSQPQASQGQPSGAQGAPLGQLTIPDQVQFLGRDDANVRKATAIVNGEVITETDIDQRLALVVASNNVPIPPEEMQRIRAQILRNLIDEALQIQAAQQRDITVEQREVDTAFNRVAARSTTSGNARNFPTYLRSIGSSERSLKRQIQAELAWQRLQQRFSLSANVGEAEVQAILDRLNASRGTREFRVSEIFISATPENAAEAQANINRIFEQIRGGASFPAYARQFSEASTAALGGDLGWVRAEQLPDVLASAVAEMPIGSVSPPIPVPGGFSIVALSDSRQILTPDARDAVLSLIQMTLTFPPGSTEAQARPLLERFVQTTQSMGGCGGAQAAAQQLGAGIVANDQLRVRELPQQLQEMLLGLGVGQATRPFGSLDREVSVLVLCGRDDPQVANAPTFEAIQAQLEEDRVNRRAQRFLRDLRRDAVIEYR